MEDLEFPFSVQKLSKEEEEISKSLRNEGSYSVCCFEEIIELFF